MKEKMCECGHLKKDHGMSGCLYKISHWPKSGDGFCACKEFTAVKEKKAPRRKKKKAPRLIRFRVELGILGIVIPDFYVEAKSCTAAVQQVYSMSLLEVLAKLKVGDIRPDGMTVSLETN
jgi:hypothetical protein